MRAALLLPMLLLAGCTQWNYYLGEPLPQTFEADARGRTLGDVLAQLGPPQRLAAVARGWVMGWEYAEVRQVSVGIGLQFLGVDTLSVDWSDARLRGEFLLVSFDRQHRVLAAARTRWDNDLGGGQAIEPFLVSAPLIDVDDMLVPLPQHAWGASSLLPPSRSINNQSRPGMGDTGIQQRGTPAGVGQRSLEID